ncbi:MAG: hypothetical protein OHK93_005220 [Ramalina farinacea]|uniref:NADH dehydrogenase [ubiquinone] 1 beta subcomplex subunit 7 n=1 Tax=Ramalina farinacea TaxID=258253 RepID=A0AA43QVM5_9LECA|nr:hypothetical protein [Ramalina farinacea]
MTVVEAAVEKVQDVVGAGDSKPVRRATREEMSAARLPLPYRDSCAHLLIPLNRCRFEEYYLPWKCETERHSYEKCQYEEFQKRVKKMDEIRAAKGGARSN